MTNEEFQSLVLKELSGIKNDTQYLKDDVQALKSDVQVLKTDVQELKSDVQVLKTDVQVLKTDVHGLKDQQERFEHKMDQSFATLTGDIYTIIKMSHEKLNILDEKIDIKFGLLNERLFRQETELQTLRRIK